MMAPVSAPTASTASTATSATAGRRRRVGRWVLGGVAVLVAALAACEIAGWPFLVQPLGGFLSNLLHREVRFDGGSSGERTRIHLLGGLTIKAARVQIAAPPWSQQPYFLYGEGGELRLSYRAMWRAHKGYVLDIDRLWADKLVVHAERTDENHVSWRFGDPNKEHPDADKPVRLPTVGSLAVRDGDVTYVDQLLKADVVGKLRLVEGRNVELSPEGVLHAGLVASARGTYTGVPLQADLQAAGATPLLATGADARSTPVKFTLSAGKAQLAFQGTVKDVLNLRGLSGTFRASGPSLAAVGDPLGVTLPTTGPFSVRGRVTKSDTVWNVVADEATVGTSQLTAALTYDTARKKPLLAGRVGGPRFYLVDLLPSLGAPVVVSSKAPGAVAANTAASAVASGAPTSGKTKQKSAAAGAAMSASEVARAHERGRVKGPRKSDSSADPDGNGRVLPDRAFDLPSLRAMDANVLFAFDRAELGRVFALPLQPLRAHVVLSAGKLTVSNIDARTADGSLRGNASLDGSNRTALWRADLQWDGVKLERWLKQDRAGQKGSGDARSYISGALQGGLDLRGQGRSTAEILGSLEGRLHSTLRDGKVSHLAIEAGGLDLAQGLGVFFKGDDMLPVPCALVDLQANKGVLTPRAMVLDTKDSTVWVDGRLSLVDESMDLRAVVSPKDFSPLTLRTPVLVKGTFAHPSVSLEKKPLVAKVGAAALLALINPLAAVIPLIDPGSNKGEACVDVLARARAGAARQPR